MNRPAPKRALLLALVLVPLTASGARAEAYLGPALRGLLDSKKTGRPLLGLGRHGPFVGRQKAGRTWVSLLLVAERGVEKDLAAVGAERVRRFGPVVALDVPLDRVPELARLPGVISARLSRRLRPHLDRSVPVLPANSTGIELTRTIVNQSGYQTTPPPWSSGSGSGVIFGLVDSGIDPSHGDFDDASGNTRILWYWDQNNTAQCTAAQIDSGSCTLTDTDIGHGSHVTGIGAGSGRGTGNGVPQYHYVGVAPEADIVAVATDFSDAGILDGAAYVFDKARSLGRPAVVNMSLGGHYGPHDGTGALALGLDTMTGPGQVVVVSAGNEGGDYIHDSGTWSGSNVSFDFQVAWQGLASLYLIYDVWHQGGDSFSIRLTEPGGSSLTCSPGQSCSQKLGGANVSITVPGTSETDPTNGDKEIIVELSGRANTGTWSMTFIAQSIDSADSNEIHAWQYYDDRADYGYPSYFSSGDNDYSVGSPGTAKSVVTVGAYTSKAVWTDINGDSWGYGYTEDDISPFSSLGPSRDGRLKPDIAAPGSAIASALFSGYTPDVRRLMVDGVHWVIDGTSMSCPHVAGFAALLLELNPNYGPEAVKSLIAWQADRDSYVGSAPSYTWGHGKLHADNTLSRAGDDLPRCGAAAAEPGGNRDSAATLVATASGFTGFQSATPRYLYQWQRLSSGSYAYFENISGATHRRLEPQAFSAGDVLRLVATPYEWISHSGYDGLLLGASCVEQFTVTSGSTPRSHTGGLSCHMVAIPTQDDDAVLGDFSEPFYLWNETLQQYQQASAVQRGRGYWIEVMSGEGAMHSNGAAAPAADFVTPQLTYTSSAFRPGRHLLGNPFAKPIWWQNTCVSTDGSTCLARVTEAAAAAYINNVYYADYDNTAGSYHYYDPADFEELDGKIFPWQGFWVVVKQPVYLLIPYSQPDPNPAAVSPPYPLVPSHPSSRPVARPAVPKLLAARAGSSPASTWRVKLMVSAGPRADHYNYLGIDPRARDGHDRFDLPDAGTMNQDHVMLWFPHDDWGRNAGRFCTDMRGAGPDMPLALPGGKQPAVGEESWQFVVQSVGVVAPVRLRWRGVPAGWSLQLEDQVTGARVEMGKQSEYRYWPRGPVEQRRFRVSARPAPQPARAAIRFR